MFDQLTVHSSVSVHTPKSIIVSRRYGSVNLPCSQLLQTKPVSDIAPCFFAMRRIFFATFFEKPASPSVKPRKRQRSISL